MAQQVTYGLIDSSDDVYQRKGIDSRMAHAYRSQIGLVQTGKSSVLQTGENNVFSANFTLFDGDVLQGVITPVSTYQPALFKSTYSRASLKASVVLLTK